MTRFAAAAAMLAIAGAANAVPNICIGGDDFDGGLSYLSRSITPDNSATNGAFPSSIFDVWGITNRTVNFDFADDSAGSFPPDTFGVLKTAKTDNVFGAEDLINPDNAAGTASATWTFDISGYTGLMIQADFAAMGDFEASNDSFVFSVSIDGGSFFDVFVSSVREDLDNYSYFLESGTEVMVSDPLAMNGTVLNNDFQTLIANIAGTGSVLTLRLTGSADGGGEVFIFDNLQIKGIPAPGAAALMGLAGLVGLRRRR